MDLKLERVFSISTPSSSSISVSSNGRSQSKQSELLSNSCSSPNSASSDIVSAILRSRSGAKIMKRETENREESWLFFLGCDSHSKETTARELAEAIFGSYDHFISFSPNNLSQESSGSVYDRLLDAVRDNPSCVFYLQDIDVLNQLCIKSISRAIEEGSFEVGNGETVLLKDAIVIFSCESSFNKEEDKRDNENEENRLLDLNIRAKQDDDDDDKKNCKPDWCRILDLVDKQVVFSSSSSV